MRLNYIYRINKILCLRRVNELDLNCSIKNEYDRLESTVV